jgi:hypothetical protein
MYFFSAKVNSTARRMWPHPPSSAHSWQPSATLCRIWLILYLSLCLPCTVTWTSNNMCALIFSTTFIQNISYSKKNSASHCHKCTFIGIHVQYPLFLPYLKKNLTFSYRYLKNTQIPNFIKSLRILRGWTGRWIDGRRGRYDETNSHFLHFFQCA